MRLFFCWLWVMLLSMVYFVLVVVGLALGSFINACVWRLHQQELDISEKKRKQNKNISILKGRSMCPRCKHQLAWFDLVPIFSWLSLGGKCRYCHKSISWQYPLVELLFMAFLVISYMFWPYNINSSPSGLLFIVWIVILVSMAVLFIYDLIWQELPTKLIYTLVFLTVIFKILELLAVGKTNIIYSALIGAVLIGGFFWLIYQFSKGNWIGGGDVRYGFIMGGLLGWQKGLLALMLSSYLGTLVIVFLVLFGKFHRRMKLPYGPFLITATYISLLWGQYFIDVYKRVSGL